MVEFTYRDYLKYHKYLKEKELKEKEFIYDCNKKEKDKKIENILMLAEEVYRGYDPEFKLNDDIKDIMKDMNKDENYNNRKKHDELFRDLLNNKEEFLIFLNKFINYDLDITISKDNIEKYNRSFVTKDYKSKYSDVVYKLKNENVFFLVEHQSTIDYSMPYRMLDYCHEIIRDSVDKTKLKNKSYKIPRVVPIVLYTGNRKWKVPDYIDILIGRNLKEIGITLKYLVIDINRYTKENLLESNSMIGYVMQSEKCKTNDELVEVIEKMLTNKINEKENIVRILKYVFNDRLEKKEIIDYCNKIEEGEVEQVMTTIRDRIARNERKIFLQGVHQERKKILIIAKYMLTKGIKEEDVLKITGLSKKELEKLNNNN